MLQTKHILYVITDVLIQDPHLNTVFKLANEQQAELSFVYVIPEQQLAYGKFLKQDEKQLLAKTETHLRQTLLNTQSSFNGQVLVRKGKGFVGIIQTVLENNIDLVIKPAQNDNWIQKLMGSEDMHLLRKCPAPVWILKDTPQQSGQTIIAAIDFDAGGSKALESPLNKNIIQYATRLAVASDAKLHILHAWEYPEEGFISLWADDPEQARKQIIEAESERQQELQVSLKQEFKKLLGNDTYDYLKPRFQSIQGRAETVITEQTQKLKADLIVMGTVARTGIPGFFMGNTAESILNQITCSVLAIKPDGFISPVTVDTSGV